MNGRALLSVEEWRPVVPDEFVGLFETVIKEDRAQHRFDNVADDIFAHIGVIFARLPAEPDVRSQAQGMADVRASFPRYQRIVAAAHIAFGLAWKSFVKPAGNYQTEYAIAQKFEPLISVPAVTSMRQRPFEHVWIMWLPAKGLDDKRG